MLGSKAFTCPYCQIPYPEGWQSFKTLSDGSHSLYLMFTRCPYCSRCAIRLAGTEPETLQSFDSIIYPRRTGRPPIPADVPEEFQKDYNEACFTLWDSPNASAALSRRALQHLLRAHVGAPRGDLYQEIDFALRNIDGLPKFLRVGLDAIRTVGKYGAHPSKSKVTGEIVDVEPGEAVLMLEILEGLFTYLWETVPMQEAKIAAVQAKIANAGDNATLRSEPNGNKK